MTGAAREPERLEPRAMLALIALAAEVPTPKTVAFHPNGEILSLTFERLAPGLAWAELLGGQTDIYVHGERRYLNEGSIRWHGWSVQLLASDPIEVESTESPLAGDVTERLSALVPAV